MRKTLMLLFVLLISAAWIQAQQYPSSGSSQSGSSNSGSAQSGSSSRSGQSQGAYSGRSSQSGQSTNGQAEGQAETPHNHKGRTSTGATKKVEGCLQSSNGSYTLTDNAGATYMLQGDTSMLAEHVGHEVQITGTPEGSSAESTGTIGGGEQTLQVKNVKHMAKTCKATK